MDFSSKGIEYYAEIEVEDVLKELKSSAEGLSDTEAKKRLKKFGYNVLAKKKETNIFLEFLSHLKSPLILILLFAALVSAFLGEEMNSIIIIVIVSISMFLDFFQKHTAEQAINRLRERVKTTATVIRNGIKKEVNVSNICIGDVIFLSAGDFVPADARVISAKDFFVNQSSLTGESFPCEKISSKIELKDKSLDSLKNIVFMGTNVVSGYATAVVVKTGTNTEFGKISKKLVSRPIETEFEKGMKNFGYFIIRITMILVLFIFLFNSLVKHDIFNSFMFSVAIAVGLTPELLPMIMSVTMAKGAQQMAKRGVIVKNLSSIPNFGSMDILCTDKTGTLTEDKIKLVKYVDVFGKDSEDVLLYAYLNSFNQTGIKNPLDQAILEFKKVDVSDYKKIDEIPFDFVRKRISVVVEKWKKRYLITKGAPEEVIKLCKYYDDNGKLVKISDDNKEEILKQYYELSKEGYRVLAVAVKQVKTKKRVYFEFDEQESKLVGFVAFLDPPKKDVKNVLRDLMKMGIEIKILTGDNEIVTKKICDEIGLNVKGILLGHEIDELTDDALRTKVENVTIFARFSPDEKNRIIHALKANGHTVGYLGDGINDAPSLKTADVGISVDNAVDVAKESADIILTNKSLNILKNGVLEGRKTFGNTMKYIMSGLSSNFGNMFSATGSVLMLPFLPMLPIQILLNNLIYDFSQITIPTDNVDEEFIQKPRKFNMSFIKKFMVVFGTISSIFDFLTFIILFWVFHAFGPTFQTGWFLLSLTTQTLVMFIIRTKKPFFKSTPSKYLLLSSILCVLLGWSIVFTSFGRIFGFEVLPINIVFVIVGLVASYLTTVEIVKRLFYRKYSF
jgi:P-type Mg2+ transporter